MWSFLVEPNFEKEDTAKWLRWVLVSVVVLAGIGLRWAGLRFISNDMRYFLIDWYDQLAKGGFVALRQPFSNYTPPYLYLLFFATKTAGAIPEVTAIKLISICFDFFNAFLIYKILKIRFLQDTVALIGASAFLLLPTVVLNSAYWGQCDSIYSFFALTCLYFLMKEQPLLAMIFLGISFSFKAQAMFMAPLIFLLILKRKIPWTDLMVIPVVYGLLMIPASLTGRSFVELLKIYVNQEEKYSALTLHAPNWYLLFPKNLDTRATVLLGLLITAIVVLAWTTVYQNKFKAFTPRVVLLGAMMSVALMPFFLPKMHERYFYLADAISFLMAFYFPEGWLLTVGYQLTSGLAYSIFLLEGIVQIRHTLAINLLISALFVNIALLGFMFSNRWNLMESNSEGNKY